MQPPIDDRIARIRGLRAGGPVDLLSGTPEEWGADTLSPTGFAKLTQADAAPHHGSEDEKYVMQVAADAHAAEDTKTLHAMSRGELPGIDVVEAIELGRAASEARLGQISVKYAEGKTPHGVAPVDLVKGRSMEEGGKLPVPVDANKTDRLFRQSTAVYVNFDRFHEHHNTL